MVAPATVAFPRGMRGADFRAAAGVDSMSNSPFDATGRGSVSWASNAPAG